MKLEIRLAHEPRAPAEARRAVESLGAPVTGDRLDDVRLLVTELVTNAIRHAHGRVDLEVQTVSGYIRVEVTDSGPGFDPKDRPELDLESMGGRGLYLVERIADRWGVENGDRTVVWFEIEAA